jgi:hypothetical protein
MRSIYGLEWDHFFLKLIYSAFFGDFDRSKENLIKKLGIILILL